MHASTREQGINRETASDFYDAADDATQAVASTSEEFASLLADAEQLARRAGRLTDVELARVRAIIEDGLRLARSSAAQGVARIGARGRQVATAADDYVRERPWTAIGIAAAVGVLIAVMSSSRR